MLPHREPDDIWTELVTRFHPHLPHLVRTRGEMLGDDYQVCELLGSNVIAVTYLVYSPEERAALVVKTLRNELLRDPAARRRFAGATRAWVRLGVHPNVARALRVDRASPRDMLVSDYVAPERGLQSLYELLPRCPPDLARVLKWGVELCRGMEHARAGGVRRHGDLKPSNLLIGYDGGLRIADPGLAAVAAEAVALPPITLARDGDRVGLSRQRVDGVGAGTPAYMAPEAFFAFERTDVEADVYSAGVVLYELASGGRRPFELPLSAEQFGNPAHQYRREMEYWRTMADMRRRPASRLDSPLEPIVRQCLEREPARRFRDFGELRRALEALAGSLGVALEPLPTSHRSTAAAADGRGVALRHIHRPREALQWHKLATAADQSYALGWSSRSATLRTLGELNAAVAAADQALAIDGELVDAWNNRGLAAAGLGRLDDAETCFNRAIALNDRSAAAWHNLAMTCDRRGRLEQADTCYARCLALDPGFGAAWHNRAACLLKLGRLDAAAAAYAQAAERDPRDSSAHFYRGQALAGLGRHVEALAAFNRALGLDSGLAEAWNDRGASLNALGKHEEALDSFERALRIDDRLPEPHCNRGLTLNAVGWYAAALPSFQRALDGDSDFVDAWIGQGVALSGLGRADEAISCFGRAIDLDPRRGDAWCGLGVAQLGLDRPDEALRCFGQAVVADPDCVTAWRNAAAVLRDRDERALSSAADRRAAALGEEPTSIEHAA